MDVAPSRGPQRVGKGYIAMPPGGGIHAIKISASLTQDLVGLTEPAVLSFQGLELGGHVRGQARACARCLARPCQPIDAASAPCSRSSRQSKSPSPTARNDPSRARKPAEPQACALPAKIGSVSCLPSLHLLKVRSLRQTRSGSAFPADAYLAPAQRAVWHARLTGVVVRLANNKPPQYFCPRQANEIKGVCAELESAQLRHPKRRSATSTIRRLQALPPIVTFYAIRLKRAAPVKAIGLET